MIRQFVPALRMLAVMTMLTGVIYPLAVTAVAQTGFGWRADGSLLTVDDQVVGSALLGQGFADDTYFHPRPSAAAWDGTASGGSNLATTNPVQRWLVATRVAAFRRSNGLDLAETVPVDAVTASGSGLDPHISVANARLQAPRVAAARGVGLREVLALVDAHTEPAQLAFLSIPAVNVLELNLALEES